jgi:hypothetical protein
VLSNASLKMTINYSVGEVEFLLPSGDLTKTTNHCLAEVVSLLLIDGLRKTTNQSHSLDITRLMRLRNLNLLSIDDVAPPCQVQGEKMKILSLQYVSILENGLIDMTEISS